MRLAVLMHEGECLLAVKVTGDTIHVLDLEGKVSLTEAISEEMQRNILSRIQDVTDNPEWFKWILYHAGGFVSSYENGKFNAVPANMLLRSFRREQMERAAQKFKI